MTVTLRSGIAVHSVAPTVLTIVYMDGWLAGLMDRPETSIAGIRRELLARELQRVRRAASILRRQRQGVITERVSAAQHRDVLFGRSRRGTRGTIDIAAAFEFVRRARRSDVGSLAQFIAQYGVLRSRDEEPREDAPASVLQLFGAVLAERNDRVWPFGLPVAEVVAEGVELGVAIRLHARIREQDPSGNKVTREQRAFTRRMTSALGEVRVGTGYDGCALIPALVVSHCLAGLYAALWTSIVNRTTFCECRRCGQLFGRRRPGQVFCRAACQNAEKQARHRKQRVTAGE